MADESGQDADDDADTALLDAIRDARTADRSWSEIGAFSFDSVVSVATGVDLDQRSSSRRSGRGDVELFGSTVRPPS